MTFDNFFKELMQDILRDFKIQSEVAVGSLPLKIDLVIRKPSKPSSVSSPNILPILTERFSEINLIEYKSSHDSPQPFDLSKLIGYLGLYASQNKIGIDQIKEKLTLWYISSSRPVFLNMLLANKIIHVEKEAGLYSLCIPCCCPFYILVVNELSLTEENFPLLLSASGQLLIDTIKLILQKNLFTMEFYKKYISLNYVIHYKDVFVMSELENAAHEELKENVALAMEHLGIGPIIELIGLKKVVDAIGLKKVIDTVGLEDFLENVDDPEEVERILQKIKINKQKNLSKPVAKQKKTTR